MFENIWIKVGVNIFNDPKMKIIDTFKEKDTIHYVWFRCMTLAGAVNDQGYLYINEDMPYTLKTLAIEFNRPVEEVKNAIKVLKKLQMIEYTEDKFFKVKNWGKYQNVDALEKLRLDRNNRVAKHRAKKKSEKVQINESNNLEVNKRRNIEDEEYKDKPNNNINNSESTYNVLEKSRDSDIRNITKNIDSNDNPTNNEENLKCNVTCNIENSEGNNNGNSESATCNVTVTDKIKREKEKKNKKKNKNSIIDREKESNNSQSVSQDEKEDNNLIATELLNHYKKIIGNTGEFSVAAINLAISIHGKDYVKMAIDKSIEVNKPNMTYINGILKNWKREGYPSEESIINNKKYNPKNLKFNNFEPRQYDYDSLEKSLLGWDKDENSE